MRRLGAEARRTGLYGNVHRRGTPLHQINFWVVDKFPLVVVGLGLVDHDGLLGAVGREADDAGSAEGLAGLVEGRRGSSCAIIGGVGVDVGGWIRRGGIGWSRRARVQASWGAV